MSSRAAAAEEAVVPQVDGNPVIAASASSSVSVNVTRYRTVVSLETWLRKDPLYYHFYCVAANTIFATVIPLVTLTFFNVSTVRALNRMTSGKQQVSGLCT